MSDARLKITLQPDVLRWARERANLDPEQLAKKMNVSAGHVLEWESTGVISLSRIEKLARCTHTPMGFLYLSEPIVDRLPIQDFRRVSNSRSRRLSTDLLDTVHAMQRRQSWMRDALIDEQTPPLTFVGSASPQTPVSEVVAAMREALRLAPDWARTERNPEAAGRTLRDRIDEAGVLVVINGVVGNNTSRKLDPNEFRGFALVDRYAPLIFVNNSDAKTAQVFTLVHELAHVWIGAEGVSSVEVIQRADNEAEVYCNLVAAEFLVPESLLRELWSEIRTDDRAFHVIAQRFKVSPIVVARRALDLELIGRDRFFAFYNTYTESAARRPREDEGRGNFLYLQNGRVGRRFGAAVVRAVRDGRLLYRDAYQLTGLKSKTFDSFAAALDR